MIKQCSMSRLALCALAALGISLFVIARSDADEVRNTAMPPRSSGAR